MVHTSHYVLHAGAWDAQCYNVYYIVLAIYGVAETIMTVLGLREQVRRRSWQSSAALPLLLHTADIAATVSGAATHRGTASTIILTSVASMPHPRPHVPHAHGLLDRRPSSKPFWESIVSPPSSSWQSWPRLDSVSCVMLVHSVKNAAAGLCAAATAALLVVQLRCCR
jgi:hypothetical protein